MITLLNTSILTAFGKFEYKSATLAEIKSLLADTEFQSAIGHDAVAEILTNLINKPVVVNRIAYEQNIGDIAIVFKLKGRAPEGKIFNREEVEKIGYDFGILTKISD